MKRKTTRLFRIYKTELRLDLRTSNGNDILYEDNEFLRKAYFDERSFGLCLSGMEMTGRIPKIDFSKAVTAMNDEELKRLGEGVKRLCSPWGLEIEKQKDFILSKKEKGKM